MASNGYDIQREEIEEFYINQGLSIADSAKKLFCTPITARKYMRLHGIKVRDISERHRGKTGRKAIFKTEEQIEELKHLYIDCKLTQAEIAKQLGVNAKTVGNTLKRIGIKVRSRSEALKNWNVKNKDWEKV